MTTTAIPDWDGRGVLPPFLNSPIEADGISPFPVSLVDIIERFGTSRERPTILGGMLRYRAELHAIGLARGSQWNVKRRRTVVGNGKPNFALLGRPDLVDE